MSFVSVDYDYIVTECVEDVRNKLLETVAVAARQLSPRGATGSNEPGSPNRWI